MIYLIFRSYYSSTFHGATGKLIVKNHNIHVYAKNSMQLLQCLKMRLQHPQAFVNPWESKLTIGFHMIFTIFFTYIYIVQVLLLLIHYCRPAEIIRNVPYNTGRGERK